MESLGWLVVIALVVGALLWVIGALGPFFWIPFALLLVGWALWRVCGALYGAWENARGPGH